MECLSKFHRTIPQWLTLQDVSVLEQMFSEVLIKYLGMENISMTNSYGLTRISSLILTSSGSYAISLFLLSQLRKMEVLMKIYLMLVLSLLVGMPQRMAALHLSLTG